jgi:CO/xanthine dehydrogenase Mo-binding subunit
MESQMDIMAHALGIDPLKLRLRNVMGKGDPVTGGVMPYSLPEQVIRAAAERAGWATWRRPRSTGRKVRGLGIAAGHWTCWASPSAASVQVNDDGSLSVVTGAINLSGTDTSFAQIAAECFGLPVARVTVTQADTDTAPYNAGSHHSRVLFGVGEAVRRAGEDAKRQLAEAFAEEAGVLPEQVEVARGQVRVQGRPGVPLGEVAGRAIGHYGAIVGRCSLTHLPFSISSCAQVAEVEVDRETGQWELLRLVCAQDVGFAINPMSVEGQIEGGASHGIGYALCEEYVYDQGQLLNANFMDFRMPTSLDHPHFEVALVEEQLDGGPFGAKGVGEPPTIPTAPAIANAIFDAVGARVTQLPLTPERVHHELARGPGRVAGNARRVTEHQL